MFIKDTKKPDNKANEDMLSTMRERFSLAMNVLAQSRECQLEDIKFLAGNSDNNYQWSAAALATRANGGSNTFGRPTITENVLPQHVKQITNDQKQNRPAIKVVAANNGDERVAEILSGIIRHIEDRSDADVAYDTASENQVTHGEGYIRLITEYCNNDEKNADFSQDLKVLRVRNSFSVFLDPMADDPCGSDAEWGFVTADVRHDEYNRRYGDKMPVSSIEQTAVGDPSKSVWLNEETVRIVEYFYKKYTTWTLNLYSNNATAKKGTPQDNMLREQLGEPTRSRKVTSWEVIWVVSNGYEVLSQTVWPGKWIPIVRIVGNEYEIDGKLEISGIIRNAKDPQRMRNYWASQIAEFLALAPKAPFIGYSGQFEGFEEQWRTANYKNWPFLEVNREAVDGEGNPLPLPQRSQPPMPQSGLMQAYLSASESIKSVTGQYNAAIGEGSNERSGKAIMARERQSDTGTYHYVDNLARGIRHLGRQMIDIIPKIYDTTRVARIIGIDKQVSTAKIDPNSPQAVAEVPKEDGSVELIYNPGIGEYDVMVTTGPGYLTKRQEALDAMTTILQTNPQLWGVVGDLLVKNMDWPGAQEMAERLAKVLDPRVVSEMSPEMQQLQQQNQALMQELQAITNMVNTYRESTEAQSVQIKEFEAFIKAYNAQTARLKAEGDIALKADQAQMRMPDIGSGQPDMLQIGMEEMQSADAPEIPQTAPQAPGNPDETAGLQPPSPEGLAGIPEIDSQPGMMPPPGAM